MKLKQNRKESLLNKRSLKPKWTPRVLHETAADEIVVKR